jgi:hypothetical protein
MVSSGLFIRVAVVRLGIFRSLRRLLVAACVVPSSPIFVILMKEAPGSSETSVLIRATRRNNPEDTVLQLLDTACVILSQLNRHTLIMEAICSSGMSVLTRAI